MSLFALPLDPRPLPLPRDLLRGFVSLIGDILTFLGDFLMSVLFRVGFS